MFLKILYFPSQFFFNSNMYFLKIHIFLNEIISDEAIDKY